MGLLQAQLFGLKILNIWCVVSGLYRSEKKGEKDYEKLGNIALDDEIDSTPINDSSAIKSEKKERNK